MVRSTFATREPCVSVDARLSLSSGVRPERLERNYRNRSGTRPGARHARRDRSRHRDPFSSRRDALRGLPTSRAGIRSSTCVPALYGVTPHADRLQQRSSEKVSSFSRRSRPRSTSSSASDRWRRRLPPPGRLRSSDIQNVQRSQSPSAGRALNRAADAQNAAELRSPGIPRRARRPRRDRPRYGKPFDSRQPGGRSRSSRSTASRTRSLQGAGGAPRSSTTSIRAACRRWRSEYARPVGRTASRLFRHPDEPDSQGRKAIDSPDFLRAASATMQRRPTT